MPSLGLIAADNLAAIYDVKLGQLILSANVFAPPSTTAITFQRLPWMGGLKFELEGLSGRPSGEPTTPEAYTVQNSFDIQLPNRATPTNTAIVVTANQPDGIVLSIQFDEFVGNLGTGPNTGPNGGVVSQDSTDPNPDLSLKPVSIVDPGTGPSGGVVNQDTAQPRSDSVSVVDPGTGPRGGVVDQDTATPTPTATPQYGANDY